jgi:hypothetical protein
MVIISQGDFWDINVTSERPEHQISRSENPHIQHLSIVGSTSRDDPHIFGSIELTDRFQIPRLFPG